MQNSAYVGISAAREALKAGNTSVEQAHALVDSAVDILGPWLDDQVCFLSSSNSCHPGSSPPSSLSSKPK